jgi:hypothetical protein
MCRQFLDPVVTCHLLPCYMVPSLPACLPRHTQGTHFTVIVTEGRPDGTGQRMAKALDEMGIPTTLVLDSGVAYALDRWVCAIWVAMQLGVLAAQGVSSAKDRLTAGCRRLPILLPTKPMCSKMCSAARRPVAPAPDVSAPVPL